MNDETLKDHLDNDKEELKLKSQLINALQVFDLLPHEQDSKYGSGKANKEDYWRICNKAIDQYTQSKLKAFAGEVEEAIGEDEVQPRPLDDESRCRFYRVGGKNFVRNQLRQAFNELLGGGNK